MKSLINALNSIAESINKLAISIQTKNFVTISETKTSNPGYNNVNITSYQPNQPKKNIELPSDLKVIADQIYKVFTEKGNYPEHHDHIIRELSLKWPELLNSLQRLEQHIDQSKGYWKTYKKYDPQIWDYKKYKK